MTCILVSTLEVGLCCARSCAQLQKTPSILVLGVFCSYAQDLAGCLRQRHRASMRMPPAPPLLRTEVLGVFCSYAQDLAWCLRQRHRASTRMPPPPLLLLLLFSYADAPTYTRTSFFPGAAIMFSIYARHNDDSESQFLCVSGVCVCVCVSLCASDDARD